MGNQHHCGVKIMYQRSDLCVDLYSENELSHVAVADLEIFNGVFIFEN